METFKKHTFVIFQSSEILTNIHNRGPNDSILIHFPLFFFYLNTSINFKKHSTYLHVLMTAFQMGGVWWRKI